MQKVATNEEEKAILIESVPGSTFNNLEEVYLFYMKHVKAKGFSIKKEAK